MPVYQWWIHQFFRMLENSLVLSGSLLRILTIYRSDRISGKEYGGNFQINRIIMDVFFTQNGCKNYFTLTFCFSFDMRIFNCFF